MKIAIQQIAKYLDTSICTGIDGKDTAKTKVALMKTKLLRSCTNAKNLVKVHTC